MNDARVVGVTEEQRSWGRVAGIMVFTNYLLQGMGDFPTIIARQGQTFGDRARWAAASQRLYQVSLLEVAGSWIAIGVLAFALYVLLRPIDRRLAQLALVLRLGASFVGASAMMLRAMEARFYKTWATEGLFTPDQARELVLVSRRSAGVGIEAAWMFQGLGSVLFFLLLWRSRYVPRALAGIVMVGSGVLVTLMAATMFVFPERINELKLVGLPGFLAELVMAVLLIKGLPRARAGAPVEIPS